jgi:hypothetical protein
MIRYFFFTLLGFFGPALIMLFLRLLWFRVRQQWSNNSQQPEIIDITPNVSHFPSRTYIILWFVISLSCTAFLIWQMDNTAATQHTYIPAHIDADGQFVPSQMIESEHKPQP